jgi:hypothetical protein
LKLKEFLTESDCIITEEQLYEMARIKQADSGLPYIMFASTKEYEPGRHWARIKVSNVPNTFSRNDNFSISIVDPRVVAGHPKYPQTKVSDIIDWVKLNYEPLMKYWNEEYQSDAEFYNELQKI